VIVLALLVLAACSGASDDTPAPGGTTTSAGHDRDEALRGELLAMMKQDQAERTDPNAVWHDRERTDRLREIVAAHGWPGSDLVGADGATAAWVIAQHSDHDPAFQQEVLELMRSAVDAGLADVTELAYLADRVAVNTGGKQTYGTQVGGCVDGVAQPAPLEDPDGVDERRAEVGLEPLAEYLATFEC
jgi:hypothetical protein